MRPAQSPAKRPSNRKTGEKTAARKPRRQTRMAPCRRPGRKPVAPPPPEVTLIDEVEGFGVSTVLFACGLARQCRNMLSKRQRRSVALAAIAAALVYVNPDLRQVVGRVFPWTPAR